MLKRLMAHFSFRDHKFFGDICALPQLAENQEMAKGILAGVGLLLRIPLVLYVLTPTLWLSSGHQVWVPLNATA